MITSVPIRPASPLSRICFLCKTMQRRCQSEGRSRIRTRVPCIMVRSSRGSQRVVITLEDTLHAELLDHSKLAAATAFTCTYQVQPTWFRFTLGLKQPFQVSFIYLMKHMNTTFIAFRVCYIQSNGWAGFLFPSPPRSNALADGTALTSGPPCRIEERG